MSEVLDRFNEASADDAAAWLDGLYEHSPWVARAAVDARPFVSLPALKRAMVEAVRAASDDAQRALLRAHPALAGKAALAGDVTAASTDEQTRAGLLHCSPDELATLHRLNDAYVAKFGWPFILAVRGPRGSGLSRAEIIAAFERRLGSTPDAEFAECLRQVDRIAELRLDERFDARPVRGEATWDRLAALAQYSDPGFAELGQLTVTYLTDAHRACAKTIERWMTDAGFDAVTTDAVGNVVGVYHGQAPDAKRLLTGSHYDTVRNAGRYDGRLGIAVPIAVVEQLRAEGRRLPIGIEVVAFAEEEGQRYRATFLGSRALTGTFDFAWLDQADADGITMRDAMRHAGLPATEEAIAALKRDPTNYTGFVEVHIEQGPVLNALDLPLGIVTSINGSVRYLCAIVGTASHAGTTPMDVRRDALAGFAEFATQVERRANAVPNLVATIGIAQIPGGSANVVPGRVAFSLDIRSPDDAIRDACIADVLAELEAICARRGLSSTIDETMRAPACPSAPAWQDRWEAAVASLGLPIQRMPSGAGHDAMQLHTVMPQAMLFVRGENGGISHNPLESTTADDVESAIEAFDALIDRIDGR